MGQKRAGLKHYAAALVVVALSTTIALLLRGHVADADLIMVFLIGVILVAYRTPLAPSLSAALLSVGAFDFFFVLPYHNFAVADGDYVLTFAVMGAAGALTSSLSARMKRQASEAAAREQRTALLSSVSHDLRTPVASILGSATALLDPEVARNAGTRGELLDTIRDEAERLSRLLSNLLEATRIQGGGLAPNREWEVPEEVIGAALRTLRRTLEGRVVDVQIDPNVQLALFDATLIELVLVNLIENAVKYSAPGTRIDISARVEHDRLTVEVKDEGVGLSEGAQERVFEKFYRAPNGVATGSGLGLSICRAIVEAHGGEIRARNRGDRRGAVFSFSLGNDGAAPEALVETPA